MRAGTLGHFLQAHGVGGVGGADHQHELRLARDHLHGVLPVGGGVADVVLARLGQLREAAAQRGDDVARVVDADSVVCVT